MKQLCANSIEEGICCENCKCIMFKVLKDTN